MNIFFLYIYSEREKWKWKQKNILPIFFLKVVAGMPGFPGFLIEQEPILVIAQSFGFGSVQPLDWVWFAETGMSVLKTARIL